MGLIAPLLKRDNHLHVDFPDAYWSIDNIGFYTSNGITMLRFDFCAYPSREVKLDAGKTLSPALEFGGPCSQVVEPVLYRWAAEFDAGLVFPSGIPTSVDAQKEILYPMVKGFLQMTDAVNVLEDSE